MAEPYRITIVTMDAHASGAFRRAEERVQERAPGLELSLHAASRWDGEPEAAERCRRDLERADLVVATQLFLPDHVSEVLPTLRAHRDGYDALVAVMSAPEVVRLTRMGGLDLASGDDGSSGLMDRVLSRIREALGGDGQPGERQLKLLRRIPRFMKYLPGTAQDVRSFLMAHAYWLAASEENLAGLVLHLAERYGPGDLGDVDPPEPQEYPTVGLYHPDLPELGLAEERDELPGDREERPAVGLVLLRSYLLAGNTAHYDAVIRALEERGLRPIPAFAADLDARPALERYFEADGEARIELLLSLTGFSLVGGPAYHDADAAESILRDLDVPYLCAPSLEFQTVDEWQEDPRGMNPVQSALMVSVPELDGATGPVVVAGRSEEGEDRGDLVPIDDRVQRLADRTRRWVELRRTPREERKIGIVLFRFPPNAGNLGTAAYLDVFASLHRTLEGLEADGYRVDVPEDPDTLRRQLLEGNAARTGAPANVHERVSADEHLRREDHLEEIEDAWGAAPGRDLTDGRDLFVLGERFGNVFVGIQPSFGYEGDPMRMLFEGGAAPTHAFSAFYRWLREDFGADALLHFGTHGALEFMPGKHVGLSERCWPDRLIGDTPNVNLYAANNPSEGAVAKRRASATLVSHLTPPVTHAGLYRELQGLKRDLTRLREAAAADDADAEALEERRRSIVEQAEALDLVDPADAPADERIEEVAESLREVEYALIPQGLHVLGRAPSEEDAADLLAAAAESPPPGGPPAVAELLEPAGEEGETRRRDRDRAVAAASETLAGGGTVDRALDELRSAGLGAEREDAARRALGRLRELADGLRDLPEIESVLRALDGGFVPPVAGGDVLRNPEILPTGRNLYGFDPHGIPDEGAVARARRQVDRLLEEDRPRRGRLPRAVGLVLWGTDNMKTGGEAVAQALALLGAEPAFDEYGRLTGARLLPLEELGRPRIDVVAAASGIFRDLLPLQIELLAEAAWRAASADEDPDRNFVRRHALEDREGVGGDLEDAALRVFSNSDGSYGANVNLLVDDGTWREEEELAEAFVNRKAYAYDRSAASRPAPALLRRLLARIDVSFQNLDSVELGLTDLDQYFDSLGGLTRAASTEQDGAEVDAYVGDGTRGETEVRTVEDQVALETRSKLLNPSWYEPLLEHGYQGVREVENRFTNCVGLSATTDGVPEWVYDSLSDTYVLDDEMRARLAEENPAAAARMADRLLEASDRSYWSPDPDKRAALENAAAELEDRAEGIETEESAA